MLGQLDPIFNNSLQVADIRKCAIRKGSLSEGLMLMRIRGFLSLEIIAINSNLGDGYIIVLQFLQAKK